MDSKITESDIDFAFNVDGHQRRLIKKLLLRVETLEKQVNSVDLADVVGQSEQLLAFGWYMMEHSNVNDGKTAKDYLQDFLSQ